MKSVGAFALSCLLLAGVAQSAVASSGESEGSQEILLRLRQSVLDNWDKLSRWSMKTVALHSEMESLPDDSWFFSDKKSQRKLIREKLMDIRKLLLSTDAQKIMERIDDIDEDIADVDEDIRDKNEQRVLRPDSREKVDADLAQLRRKRK